MNDIKTLNVPSDLDQPVSAPATPQVLAAEIVHRLTYSTGKDPKSAKLHDWLNATILTVRDRIIDHWMDSTRRAYRTIRNGSTTCRWSS